MEQLQYIIDQIPIRHNLVSQFMFLGVVQGLFISMLLFLKSRKNQALLFFGISLLFQSIVFLDTYVCYTGLMKEILFLNDSTEPLVLGIAPTFYLFTYSLILRRPFNFKTHWWHFLLPVVYALSQIPYYLAPVSIKLNAYLGAYHTHVTRVAGPENFNYGYHHIKDIFDWLVLFSFLFYGILSVVLVRKEWKRIRYNPYQERTNKYLFGRNSVIILFVVFIIIFMVFYNYEDDGGDHYIAFIQTIIAFVTTYVMLNESRFFEKSWIADKYETLTSNGVHFEDIETFVSQNNYYESPSASLKNLANQLNSSSNLISKIINSHTGNNFNDYINQKRVLMAKKRLLDPNYAHLTIEAIGNSVGFNSKSTFYAAFNKHARTSPSAFFKAHKNENPS